MLPQRQLTRLAPRLAAQIRTPAARNLVQRRMASSTGQSTENEFVRERQAVQDHAAATTGKHSTHSPIFIFRLVVLWDAAVSFNWSRILLIRNPQSSGARSLSSTDHFFFVFFIPPSQLPFTLWKFYRPMSVASTLASQSDHWRRPGGVLRRDLMMILDSTPGNMIKGERDGLTTDTVSRFPPL